jgi:hypothetical protein
MLQQERRAVFYLSASIAASLAASRLSVWSARHVIIICCAALNAEIVSAILGMMYKVEIGFIASLVIAVLTLIWVLSQLFAGVINERELRDALSVWSKELAELSGDLIDRNATLEEDKQELDQKIRIIQRFLESLTSTARPSSRLAKD